MRIALLQPRDDHVGFVNAERSLGQKRDFVGVWYGQRVHIVD
jgi:hypothetical protein